jgi:putative phosphoesterase
MSSTKIGILSDPHAAVAPLREALDIFSANNVGKVFCLGDIAGYGKELQETIELLIFSKCECIKGNHERWYIDKVGADKDVASDFFENLPATIEVIIEGIKLYFVHASPPEDDMNGIRLLDEQGKIIDAEKKKWTEQLDDYDFDVLIVGHTHQVFHEKIGNKMVVNPGSTSFNHTCMIMSLPDMAIEIFTLSNKKLILSWNWSMMRSNI